MFKIILLICILGSDKPLIKTGGYNMEASCRAEAVSQLRRYGGITEGTIIHEGTHFLNAELGGSTLLKPSNSEYGRFYFWGENKYIEVPTIGIRKSEVAPLVPRECVTDTTFNNYFGPMFSNRDAVHVIEDFVAELNGFEEESPDLLRDMLIYSLAVGVKMDAGGDQTRAAQYRAGVRYIIDRAVKKKINLSAFKQSKSTKAITLRKYAGSLY